MQKREDSMKQIIILIAAITTFLVAGIAGAADFYAAPAGVGVACSQAVPCALLDALNAASANDEDDTVHLAAGTYDASGGNTFAWNTTKNYAVTIIGSGSGASIIDGKTTDQGMLLWTSNVAGNDTNAHITVQNLTFKDGNYNGDGGGLQINTLDADVTVDHCDFTGNSASMGLAAGGGLYIATENGTITVKNSEFNGNSAAGYGAGAEIEVANSGTIQITNNVFSNNPSGDYGGGAYIDIESNSTATVSNNVFAGNSAAGTAGGGLYFYSNQGNAIVTGNLFDDNSSIDGGGMLGYTNAGSFTVTNNTFVNNSATRYGGALYADTQPGAVAFHTYNNIFRGNTALDTGPDAYLSDAGGITNNMFNNIISGYYSVCENTGGCTPDINYVNNITSNPLFVDAASGDFHLQEGSPAIDAGNNNAPSLPAQDFEGDQRTIDGDEDGTATVDIGVDEFVPNPSISLSVAALDFASTPGGRSITVTNTGTVLAIGAIASADPLAPPFSITADTCSNTVLPHLGTCSITVDFDPATVAAVPKTGAFFAGMGLLFFGAAITGSRRRRQFVITLLILAALGGFLSSCSGSSGGRTPVNYSDTFDVPSNDPVNPSVTVLVSGLY